MNRFIQARLLVSASLLCLMFVVAGAPANAEGGTWPPVGQLAGGLPQAVAVKGDYAYVAADGAIGAKIGVRIHPV